MHNSLIGFHSISTLVSYLKAHRVYADIQSVQKKLPSFPRSIILAILVEISSNFRGMFRNRSRFNI